MPGPAARAAAAAPITPGRRSPRRHAYTGTMNSLKWLVALASVVCSAATAAAPEARVIVGFKAGTALGAPEPAAAGAPDRTALAQHLQRRADGLAARLGRPLVAGRALGERQQVLRASGLDSATLAAQLAAQPDVAWAVPDERRRALLVPTDPLYLTAPLPHGPEAGQWYLRPPDALFRSAADLQTAWDRITGLPDIVVAVVDTGVRPEHPDLAGVLLPGIDTIVDLATAGDGDGADGDASDPGDWTDAGSECGAYASSWHGTQVSTVVAAAANDGVGMAGTAFGVKVLPVRVLGKCGGYDSDIIAGMLWAAGLQTVAGRTNPPQNRARVLNLSLGGAGTCTQPYVDAVARINATGAVVVVAAGNDAGLAVGTPANCPGVIGVGGLRHAGSKVGFSDLGPEIALSAPGGNCINVGADEPCLYPILAGTNSGLRGPVLAGSTWTDSYNYSVGTSFSAPIVAGAAALVLSHRPELRPDELRTVLQVSARDFPQDGATNLPLDPTPVAACLPPSEVEQYQCYCPNDGSLCGAGMLDAHAALMASELGFARIELLSATPTAGQPLQLDGASSLAPLGRSVAGYAWAVVAGRGSFTGATDAASATLTPTAAGTLVVRLTVIDNLGGQSSVDSAISVTAAPTSPSSGGGALGGAWLLALAMAAAALRRR